MVAALNHENLHGCALRKRGVEFVGRAEVIARALHDQDRDLDLAKVSGAQLPRLPGWMQGIAQAQQPGEPGRELLVRGGQMRSDPPAQRFAADEKLPVARVAPSAHAGDHRSIAALELYR